MNASKATNIGEAASSGRDLLISRCLSAVIMQRNADAFIMDFRNRMNMDVVLAAGKFK